MRISIDTNEIEEKEKVKSYSGFRIQCGHCQVIGNQPVYCRVTFFTPMDVPGFSVLYAKS